MAMATSPQSILVQWEEIAPISQNGIIIMYEVCYQPVETFRDGRGTVNVTELAVNLTGLQGFVTYNISVRAYTSVGEGPYSVGIAITTPNGKYTIAQ